MTLDQEIKSLEQQRNAISEQIAALSQQRSEAKYGVDCPSTCWGRKGSFKNWIEKLSDTREQS